MDDLVKKADLALYRMKGAGRNGFRFFDARIDAPAAPALPTPMFQAS